ncbi:MAG: hypothetical protein R3253_09785 [Longimicrobiales bacterium]|nr:hypothetical protein [Longimicrobiales bacterium]
MKRLAALASSILLALALATPGIVQAQSVFIGGGASVPTGDFSDFGDGDGANAGWMGFGGVLFPIGEAGLSAGVEGFFGSNSHDTDGDKTDLYGGMALLGYSFGAEGAAVSPLVFGGLGFLTHSYKSESFPSAEGSESGLALGFGAGLGFPLGGVGGMLAASYNMGLGDVDATTFIGISAAIQIAMGGGSM